MVHLELLVVYVLYLDFFHGGLLVVQEELRVDVLEELEVIVLLSFEHVQAGKCLLVVIGE